MERPVGVTRGLENRPRRTSGRSVDIDVQATQWRKLGGDVRARMTQDRVLAIVSESESRQESRPDRHIATGVHGPPAKAAASMQRPEVEHTRSCHTESRSSNSNLKGRLASSPGGAAQLVEDGRLIASSGARDPACAIRRRQGCPQRIDNRRRRLSRSAGCRTELAARPGDVHIE